MSFPGVKAMIEQQQQEFDSSMMEVEARRTHEEKKDRSTVEALMQEINANLLAGCLTKKVNGKVTWTHQPHLFSCTKYS